MLRLSETTDAPSASACLVAMAEERSGALAFDVGANIGQASRLLAPYFTEVTAFEPARESFGVLKTEAPANARPFCLAVSDHTGVITLDVAEASILSGQLVTAAAAPGHPEWGEPVSTREVNAITIDDCVGRCGRLPALIKVDTEGHELRVVNGARNVINLGYSSWFIEVHASLYGDLVPNHFSAKRYRIERLEHEWLAGRPEAAHHFYLAVRPRWLD